MGIVYKIIENYNCFYLCSNLNGSGADKNTEFEKAKLGDAETAMGRVKFPWSVMVLNPSLDDK